MKNLPIQIKVIIYSIVLLILISGVYKTYKVCENLYNKTTLLKLDLQQLNQKQLTNYDGYYQIFIDKQENAHINKETFLEVTNIIMSSRKDGESLSWKWNVENQQIPYNEFTDFYKDLSAFISERYHDNMSVENSKQDIVKQHNILLDTYPNKIFNKVLGIKPLEYKVGFITETTKQKFK